MNQLRIYYLEDSDKDYAFYYKALTEFRVPGQLEIEVYPEPHNWKDELITLTLFIKDPTTYADRALELFKKRNIEFFIVDQVIYPELNAGTKFLYSLKKKGYRKKAIILTNADFEFVMKMNKETRAIVKHPGEEKSPHELYTAICAILNIPFAGRVGGSESGDDREGGSDGPKKPSDETENSAKSVLDRFFR